MRQKGRIGSSSTNQLFVIDEEDRTEINEKMREMAIL